MSFWDNERYRASPAGRTHGSNWDNESEVGIDFVARTSTSPEPQNAQSLIHRIMPVLMHERASQSRRNFLDSTSSSSSVKWADMFFEFFVPNSCNEAAEHELQDDLLFIVRRSPKTDSRLGECNETVDVLRKDNIAKLPSPSDYSVGWEETVCLNLILNHLEYMLTCAVCSRSTPKDLQILKRKTTRVFASPSKRRMDSKGDAEEMSYPNIFFSVDDFEHLFSDIIIRDGEMVCVELVAKDPLSSAIMSVLFLGSVRYELLKQVFDTRASLGNKVAERVSWFNQQRTEFVRMKGPQGRGYAEMAVSKMQGSKPTTPSQNEDDEYDFGDLLQMNANTRRQSDPFRQIGQPSRRVQSASALYKSYSDAWYGGISNPDANVVQANPLQDEVEPGAFYNQWGLRGLNQAWHWYKERRRNGSIALNAHLTYVSLPWQSIMTALLDEKSQPVLLE